MYRVMAGKGKDAGAKGWNRILKKLHHTDKRSSVGADLQTYSGTASSAWKKEEGQLQMDVVPSPNTKALI